MDLLTQAFASITVLAATWFVLQSAGIRRDSLFYSREEVRSLDARFTGRFGAVATVTNIFGTLTSLATVYVFFIGTSKVFGGYTVFSLVGMIIGAFVTNSLTVRTLKRRYVHDLYRGRDQISAVLATLIFRDDRYGSLNAAAAKWISLTNIFAVLWLEIATFADLTGLVYAPGTLSFHATCFFLAAFAIVYFVTRFGLRGFVFGELLQSPLIAVSTLVVLGGIAVVGGIPPSSSYGQLFTPLADESTVVLFSIHAVLVNAFFVVVTEGHWFRVWLFGDKTTDYQVPAIGWTTAGWLLLISIGLLGGLISANTGSAGVADVLRFVGQRFEFVSFAFWIAAVAALLSTADANLFSLLVVHAFAPTFGKFNAARIRRVRSPEIFSAILATGGAMLYFVVRHYNISLEKLIFVCIPFALNLLPSVVCIAFQKVPQLRYTLISVAGYVALSLFGLLQPNNEFFVTLMAAVFPIIVSLWARVAAPHERDIRGEFA